MVERVYTFAAKNLALQGKDEQWPLEYYPNLNTPALEAGDGGKGLLQISSILL